MKARLMFVLMALTTSAAFASTTLTINTSDFTGANPVTSIRIDLQNCSNARLSGTGQIVPQTQTITPVAGVAHITLFSNTDPANSSAIILCQTPSGQQAVSYYSFSFIYQGVITGVGSYNLIPGTFNLIDLTPCVGPACIGNGSGGVTRIIAGNNITISPTNGLGQVTINSTGGGGGAGNPSLPLTSIQFNDGGSFGGGTKTSMDEAGNGKMLSFNGMADAFENQTTPTSNNGVHNALQVQGSAVQANPDYNITEFQSYGNNCRFPMFFTGFPIVPVCGIADQTTLYDYRAFSRGRFDYNPNPNSGGGPPEYNKLIRANNVDGYQTFEDYVNGQQIFCCSPPSNGFGQSFFTGWEFNLQDNTNEITSTFTIQTAKQGQGDFQAFQVIQHVNGQFGTPSDEGGANMRRISVVDNRPFFGTLNSSVAPGNNVFPITPNSDSIYGGEMKLMTNRTQLRSPYIVTATTGAGYPNPGTFTIQQTVTPDTRCVITSTISVNGKIKGGTTSTTFNVTGCTASVVANNSTLPACIAGNQNVQSVRVTSGGTSSITAPLYSGISNGDVLYQGPNACGAVEILADQHGSYSHIVQIIGAPSAHVLEYVSLGAGSWQAVAGGFGAVGAFSTFGLTNTATLVRNGSGTVSANVTFQDTTGLFTKACLNVTSAVNSSFNGIHCVLTDDRANPTTITWGDAGGAATTTTTAISYQLAGNAFQANAITYYPAARIVQATNPTTGQNDGTMVTMEHGWTGNTSDILASGPSDQLPFTLDHSTFQNEVPTSPSLAAGTYAETSVINPPPGSSFINLSASTNNGDADFIRGGGTTDPTYVLLSTRQQAVFNGYFSMGFTPVGTNPFFMRIQNCGIVACSSPLSVFDFVQLPGAGGPGSYSEKYHPDTQTMEFITGGNEVEIAPTFTFFGAPINVQAEVSVNPDGSGAAVFDANASSGSFPTAAYETQAVGAHNFSYQTWGTGNSLGLAGVNGSFDGTSSVFTWSTCGAGGIFFGTPTSGGDVCHGVGAVAGIDASGNLTAASGKFGAPTTFAALTAAVPCSGTTEGTIAAITDSNTQTWGATAAGGGAFYNVVTCNGSVYTVMGK